MEFVNALSDTYEPLRYPLLFTTGQKGWGADSSKKKLGTSEGTNEEARDLEKKLQGSDSLLVYLRKRMLREPRFRQLTALGQAYLVHIFALELAERGAAQNPRAEFVK